MPYALVNRNTEVGMSGEQLGDFTSRENVWKLTYPDGHQSRDWTRGLTLEQSNENLKFPLWIQASDFPQEKWEGGKLSSLRE